MNSMEEKLKDYWLGDKVKVNPGASNEVLERFESKYKVKLPPDLRKYFSGMNGMTEGETDKDLIRFWPIEELVPLSEYHWESILRPEARSLFIFADWSIEAHLYTIQFGKDNAEANKVFVMGQHQRGMQEVAESFTDFAS